MAINHHPSLVPAHMTIAYTCVLPARFAWYNLLHMATTSCDKTSFSSFQGNMEHYDEKNVILQVMRVHFG